MNASTFQLSVGLVGFLRPDTGTNCDDAPGLWSGFRGFLGNPTNADGSACDQGLVDEIYLPGIGTPDATPADSPSVGREAADQVLVPFERRGAPAG